MWIALSNTLGRWVRFEERERESGTLLVGSVGIANTLSRAQLQITF